MGWKDLFPVERRYYETENGILYCGDAIEVLKTIPPESVDLIVTDPPYAVGVTSNGKRAEWHDNSLVRPFFEILFKEYKRILKGDGEFYINTDWRTYPFLYPILLEAGLHIQNCIVWDYGWIKAGTHYRFSHEFIIYGTKVKNHKRKFPASERDVWRIKPINFTSKKKLHNTQKPVELVAKCILNSSRENDIVLDSFLGSGTTAVASEVLGRRWIGIEISKKYCDVTVKRLEKINEKTVDVSDLRLLDKL